MYLTLAYPTRFLSLNAHLPIFLVIKPATKFLFLGKKTMSTKTQPHAFAGNPLRASTSNTIPTTDESSFSSAFSTLKSILDSTQEGPWRSCNVKVLPFKRGKPLASSSVSPSSSVSGSSDGVPLWHLGWQSLLGCKDFLGSFEVKLSHELLVFLGKQKDVSYWAIDVSAMDSSVVVAQLKGFSFVELRTLMVATDWADTSAMGELAVAGHARALLEWHNLSRFCGYCGARNIPTDGGRRKQCVNESCKKKIYPRIDPVVIMLVIDKDNDRALLSRQSRFVPRMWSCIAGFIEPGESLEEAVRRETIEETGIEIGDVVYHSSQPWPVGPSSMPCQLMVGFFAYAKSFEIRVDKEELEDAQWHSREDVKKALASAEYKKAQRNAAFKVDQMCKGVEKGHSFSADFNVESGELAQMFVPGPFAIAHHLIAGWANGHNADMGPTTSNSVSNL
ncbi:nudix hydrolase 19, chloroplastic [Amborella trichopoda]|uniref:NAD(+) diphosphatase n=1 Tax=Amborella trichopoda TaxID=13333 RepID=W1P988_AMBTC|nr:nudix hydrolase 19, chloroplastic [Amborella trichopoda]ERN04498.1 hypothetical protein AMTR_s00081p00076550 [Amborella trichopoda]|eukprot:XP_006842823.1 nudix hydrolase 19, chloroplastic [Amborella trichopoda]